MTFQVKHGKSFSREYNCWVAMKKRCNYSKHPAYSRYKGMLCDKWHTFSNFYADMGDAPTAKHTIDRIDNNEGYYPENCRWATMKEQERNRRNTLWVKAHGKKIRLSEYAEQNDLTYSAAYMRLWRGNLEGVVKI